jgi:nicotinamide phosphoribosyltransferase
MIDYAEEEAELTLGYKSYFNRAAWEHVRDLGYLPIRIKALPEGMEVPVSTPLFTLESTDPKFATSLNSLESILMHVWYPTTIATAGMYIKRGLAPLIEQSASSDLMWFLVNDFGYRGATCDQAAARGGAAHLLHFRGSDNMRASSYFREIYGTKGRALSVWATEHSVETSFGPDRGEFDYLNHQLDNAPDDATISIVIDGYDTFNFLESVVGSPEIKEKILKRSGRTVFRPDSGEPVDMVTRCFQMLSNVFGTTLNQKGYKVFNRNVGIIQGDGMNPASIVQLFEVIVNLGYSTDNLVTGSGGGLLQENYTRDTQRFAIKASYGERLVDVYNPATGSYGFNIEKHPSTDGSKKSKAGRHSVIYDADGNIVTVSSKDSNPVAGDLLRTVYENGQLVDPQDGESILARAKSN